MPILLRLLDSCEPRPGALAPGGRRRFVAVVGMRMPGRRPGVAVDASLGGLGLRLPAVTGRFDGGPAARRIDGIRAWSCLGRRRLGFAALGLLHRGAALARGPAPRGRLALATATRGRG